MSAPRLAVDVARVRVYMEQAGWRCCLLAADNDTEIDEIFITNGNPVTFPLDWHVEFDQELLYGSPSTPMPPHTRYPKMDRVEHAPLVGDVYGLRGWRIKHRDYGWRLHGVGVPYTWHLGVQHACCQHGGMVFETTCHETGGVPPVWECGCGFWSQTDVTQMFRAMTDYRGSMNAVGVVKVWGRCIGTQFGLRSEYAQMVCVMGTAPGGVQEELAAHYQVPVETGSVATAGDWMKEHGLTLGIKEDA